MSKSRVSTNERTASGSSVKNFHRVIRYLGISLSGGKQDKACICALDYYPEQKRIFLSKIFEKIKNEENISADLKIHEILDQYSSDCQYLAVDVPYQLPLCMTCQLKCPGFENCREPHIEWMWDHFRKLNKKKKPKRIFTPYTQRAVEMHLATELEEVFNLPHAMGSNMAPLLARAHFISRRYSQPIIEVNAKVSLWRIGRSLGIAKSHLRFHRHTVGGDESRRLLLESLEENNIAFLYEQDRRMMIENNHAFESFICALTAFLKDQKATVPRPKDFPDLESWIDFPVEKINWKSIF